jgi:2'-5' RNA ligase superfamily
MGAAHQDLIAIDVLLVPDRATIDKSISLNAQLRANYPTGYALDATRIPHLTLLQRFVPAKDFEAVCAIITNVLDDEPPTAMTLTATSIDSVSFEGLAVAVLVVERTPKLMRLHQEITDAVVPFSVGGGSPAAFADAKVAAGTVDWVETFVPKSSGKNYQPHITAGIAAEAFVAHLKAAPFMPFAFKADALAVFQLGNFGTAARKLWEY